VNPAMQVSQENGNTAGTAIAYYAADQWSFWQSGGGAYSFQRVQVTTPKGSRDRLRLTVTTADAVLDSTDLLQMFTYIEGVRIADLLWSAAQAKQIIIRFGFKAPAGTYALQFLNGASNRSYIALFTISAGQTNVDTEQVFVVPGDVTGTWASDTSKALTLCINVGAGSSLLGVAGWQAGNIAGAAGMTNGRATLNNTFELFDVGLYADPNNTGLPPAWVTPDYADELARCQRYYSVVSNTIIAGYNGAGAAIYQWLPWPQIMRVTPATAFFSFTVNNASNILNNGGTPQGMQVTCSVSATGAAWIVYSVAMNARM